VSATPPSLLHRLSEAPDDADAWRRFDDIYRPLLGGWLRRYALQDHDADDLVQDVLRAVAGELPHFHYVQAWVSLCHGQTVCSQGRLPGRSSTCWSCR
jgi:RNA polymerase sigma-70 factor (ECF subfamily)